MELENKTISEIAFIIDNDWRNQKDRYGNKPGINYGAKPYLSAMFSLQKVTDEYGMDSGKNIILYFLCNASQWKGEIAKEVKKYLKKITK